MRNDYAVRISKLSKYHGKPCEDYKQGQIHEEEYIFYYEDYSEALDSYNKYCIESAKIISMPVSFNQTHVIQILDWEGTNPNKDRSAKRRIMFQLTISNL